MLKTLTLPLAALALLAAGTAVAQNQDAAQTQAPQRGADMTRDAAETRAAAMFERLDVNSDGELSDADREERMQARADARFARMDADGNGSIDRAEFDAVREQRNTMREQRTASGEERRSPGTRERRGRRGGGMGNARRIIATADADSSGTITQAEFTNAALARFDAADANSDGTVSREERRNARPEGRRGHQGNRARGRMIG